nr:glycosyltransferase family 4 protein [uncultured Dyadobacter sp.]
MKILAIHNILWSHYKARIFVGLHQKLQKQQIQFYVLQLAYSERSRLALKADLTVHTYPHKVLFPAKAIEDIGTREKTRSLLSQIMQYQPDILYLNGYYDPSYWVVLAYCKLRNIRIVLDFESNEISRRRIWWKEYMKMFFLRQCDGLACLGSKAADYALKLKVKPFRILTTKNVGVDNDALSAIYTREFPLREQRKAELGLQRYNFLYAGRFVERKNLDRLIRAFYGARKQSANGHEWGLILSGEGEEKEKLLAIANEDVGQRVAFLEPCEWYEVPIRYTLADVAVLPSTFEPFGFVTNEAMVYQMPVLVSERCGSAPDLVVDGHNGFQFNPFDEADLTRKLKFLMEHTEKFTEWGVNGKKIIDEWSPDIIVDKLIDSFLKVYAYE